jgi:hypothetical protein
MPELNVNLLSLYALNEKSLNTIFNFKDCLIRKEKTIITHKLYQRKISVFQAKYIEPDVTTLYIEKNPKIWHERLSHITQKALTELPKETNSDSELVPEKDRQSDINLNKSLKGSHSLQKANSDTELVLEQDRQSETNSDPELVLEQNR